MNTDENSPEPGVWGLSGRDASDLRGTASFWRQGALEPGTCGVPGGPEALCARA